MPRLSARWYSVAMLAIGCASLGWAIWLITFGGFDHTVLGIRIRSNNPSRAVLVAVLAMTGFLLAGGGTSLFPILDRVRRWPAAWRSDPAGSRSASRYCR